MGKLLVAGAINTDLIAFVQLAPRAGETVAGGHFEQHGGGKGANQAVAAARSGADVTLLSAVGNDDFGSARLSALLAEGIAIKSVATFDDVASGVAVITVEASGENRICDLPGARESLTPDLCLIELASTNPTAILAANELPFPCLEAMFLHAREHEIPVWFNAAPYSDHARKLIPLIDTLIVNRGEAEDILGLRGEDRSIDDLANGLRDLGVGTVVVTLGAEGVRGFRGDQDIAIPAEEVTPVDTTGAGDTFCGAWAAETLRNTSFADALGYANKASAISVTRRGAQSSIPSRDEVQAGTDV